jgi:hypothetical protein
MKSIVRAATVVTLALGTFAAIANDACACWSNRVYTRNYSDPCVTCSVPTTMRCASPPTCYTSTQQCNLEPQAAYRTVARVEPQFTYVRRAYYDPTSCCERYYVVPTAQYVTRYYQVPACDYVPSCVMVSHPSCPTDNGWSSEGDNQSKSGSSQPEPAPAEREDGTQLKRPVYRESTPPTEPPPRPVPMPSPQTSRGRRVGLSDRSVAGR